MEKITATDIDQRRTARIQRLRNGIDNFELKNKISQVYRFERVDDGGEPAFQCACGHIIRYLYIGSNTETGDEIILGSHCFIDVMRIQGMKLENAQAMADKLKHKAQKALEEKRRKEALAEVTPLIPTLEQYTILPTDDWHREFLADILPRIRNELYLTEKQIKQIKKAHDKIKSLLSDPNTVKPVVIHFKLEVADRTKSGFWHAIKQKLKTEKHYLKEKHPSGKRLWCQWVFGDDFLVAEWEFYRLQRLEWVATLPEKTAVKILKELKQQAEKCGIEIVFTVLRIQRDGEALQNFDPF